MDNLDFPQAVEEIKEAVQHLRNEGSQKVGAIGFCMGECKSAIWPESSLYNLGLSAQK